MPEISCPSCGLLKSPWVSSRAVNVTLRPVLASKRCFRTPSPLEPVERLQKIPSSKGRLGLVSPSQLHRLSPGGMPQYCQDGVQLMECLWSWGAGA